MAINDFSAIIQLAATLCIAFVTVEYVKSFIDILCEFFFKFQVFIADSFQECRSILTDRDTLDHIEPISIEGKSTNSEIEEAKRQNEALNKEIKEEEEKKKKEVKISCQVRSMSSLCFFLFLVSIFILLIGGIEKKYTDFSHVLVTFLDTFGGLYLVIGWFVGEIKCPKKIIDFSSLRHPSIGFLAVVSISFILTEYVLLKKISLIPLFDIIWWFSLLAFIALTYFNFIVFTFKIKNKARAFKKEVEKAKCGLITKCKEAEVKVEELRGLSRINARLKSD